MVGADLLGSVDAGALAEGGEADVRSSSSRATAAEPLQLDALAAREVAADGAVEGFQHRHDVGVAHGGDFGYLVAQLVGRDATHGDGGGIVLAGLSVLRLASPTVLHFWKAIKLVFHSAFAPSAIESPLDFLHLCNMP